MTSPQAPGWYPNPDGSPDLRWWDGYSWTARTRPGTDVSRPTRRQTVVALVVLALVLTAVLVERWIVERPASTNDIFGMFTINELVEPVGGPCASDGGYSDVREGLGVVVKDEQGTTLANAALEPGERTGGFEFAAVCSFPFVLNDVPQAAFYTVSVGSRGEITYSHQQIIEAEWKVALSLGDFGS